MKREEKFPFLHLNWLDDSRQSWSKFFLILIYNQNQYKILNSRLDYLIEHQSQFATLCDYLFILNVFNIIIWYWIIKSYKSFNGKTKNCVHLYIWNVNKHQPSGHVFIKKENKKNRSAGGQVTVLKYSHHVMYKITKRESEKKKKKVSPFYLINLIVIGFII